MPPPEQPLSAELSALADLFRTAEADAPGGIPMAATLIGTLQLASRRALLLEMQAHCLRAEAEAFRASRHTALAAAEASGKLLHFRRHMPLRPAFYPHGGTAA